MYIYIKERKITMNSINAVSDIRKNHTPLIRTEHKGVQITIAFTEDAPERNIKQILVDMLTKSYEHKIVSESASL